MQCFKNQDGLPVLVLLAARPGPTQHVQRRAALPDAGQRSSALRRRLGFVQQRSHAPRLLLDVCASQTNEGLLKHTQAFKTGEGPIVAHADARLRVLKRPVRDLSQVQLEFSLKHAHDAAPEEQLAAVRRHREKAAGELYSSKPSQLERKPRRAMRVGSGPTAYQEN